MSLRIVTEWRRAGPTHRLTAVAFGAMALSIGVIGIALDGAGSNPIAERAVHDFHSP